MKPIIVNGRILSCDDLASLKQHVDMMASAAQMADDQYYSEAMTSIAAVLQHCIDERMN